jgi:hypothetical protein
LIIAAISAGTQVWSAKKKKEDTERQASEIQKAQDKEARIAKKKAKAAALARSQTPKTDASTMFGNLKPIHLVLLGGGALVFLKVSKRL